MMYKSSGTVFLINIYLQLYITDLFSMGEKKYGDGYMHFKFNGLENVRFSWTDQI